MRLSACRIRAVAKVNLDLRVVGVRSDGYHALATVFQSVDVGDELTIEPGGPGGIQITCADPDVPLDDRNLVWRAAHALCHTLALEVPDLRVSIDKAIPAQTGLGGGSADAAAMLMGLNAMLGGRASRTQLASVAATLGADVPFMLVGGAALGTGRGDVLLPLRDLPSHDIVIVCPDFGVSTSDAYRWFDEERRLGGTAAARWTSEPLDWHAALATCTNDLEAAVSRRHPEIATLVRELRVQGARLAAMTGSGSGVFGLFAPDGAAARAATALMAPGRAVVASRTLSRAEFERVTRPRVGTVSP